MKKAIIHSYYSTTLFDWHSAPFGKLQALPKDAKPITEWDNQDKAFTHIA